MLPITVILYRNWLLSPRRDGRPGLTVLIVAIWRLRIARYMLRLSQWMAAIGLRLWPK